MIMNLQAVQEVSKNQAELRKINMILHLLPVRSSARFYYAHKNGLKLTFCQRSMLESR